MVCAIYFKYYFRLKKQHPKTNRKRVYVQVALSCLEGPAFRVSPMPYPGHLFVSASSTWTHRPVSFFPCSMVFILLFHSRYFLYVVQFSAMQFNRALSCEPRLPFNCKNKGGFSIWYNSVQCHTVELYHANQDWLWIVRIKLTLTTTQRQVWWCTCE